MTDPERRYRFTRFLAAAQIAGASGSAIAVAPAVSSMDFSVGNLFLSLLMFGFFGIAFVSGIWLWNDERRGYVSSSIVHIAQIPFVVSSLVTYQFVFGFGLTLSLGGEGFVSFDVGAKSFLLLFSEAPEFRIGVNIWAAIVAAYLWRRWQAPAAPAGVETDVSSSDRDG